MKPKSLNNWNDFQKQLVARIRRRTKEPLYVSSWGWRPWQELRDALRKSYRPVFIFLGGMKEQVNNFGNVRFYMKSQLHCKLIIDGSTIISGSFNISDTRGWFNHAILIDDQHIANHLLKLLRQWPVEQVEQTIDISEL